MGGLIGAVVGWFVGPHVRPDARVRLAKCGLDLKNQVAGKLGPKAARLLNRGKAAVVEAAEKL
jgi:hypothetical protein